MGPCLSPECASEPAPVETRNVVGTVAGILGVLVIVGAIFAAVVALAAQRARASERRTQSSNDLSQIALACERYADDHGGRFPQSLELLCPQYVGDRGILGLPPPGSKRPARYTLVPQPAGGNRLSTMIVAYETENDGGGRNVAYRGGRVVWLGGKAGSAEEAGFLAAVEKQGR